MNEIELRFQIPAAQLEAVRRWVAGEGKTPASPARSERLQASYFDTPERDLARAGFALRLRREGEVWVQTLKGAADDGMTRLEHNVPLGADEPALDITRHADHPAGRALVALLESLPAERRASVRALFRTDIERMSRTLRTRHGSVELALDIGALLAGQGTEGDDAERRLPVAELEIELKSGSPRAVLETARTVAIGRFGLSLELRTKALRGDLLARRRTAAAVRASVAPRWTVDQSRGQALMALLKASIEPVLGNASQIIAGVHEPEHVHQLRVALRRLRIGARLLAREDEPALLALADGAAGLSRALTPARDADVQALAPWRAALESAWQVEQPSAALRVVDEEQAIGAPVVPVARRVPTDAFDAAALLRAPEWQGWMLAVIGWMHHPLGDETPAREAVATSIDGWRRGALKLVKRFDRLDVEGRHHLRRRLRRLRLALEMAAALPLPGDGARLSKKEAAARERLLKRVHAAQRALGDLNDLEVALTAARRTLAGARADGEAGDAARAAFELGWLSPRHADALALAAKRLRPLR